MWTVTFTTSNNVRPINPAIGDMTAYWNKGLTDEFIYNAAINLTDPIGIDIFISQAKELLFVKQQPDAISIILDRITSQINRSKE